MTAEGARSLDDVLAAIAVPGTDPGAVSEYVLGALGARRRRFRIAAATAGVLMLLAGGTALALSGGEDPDEVVAVAGDETRTPEEKDDPPDGSDPVVTTVPSSTVPANGAVVTVAPPIGVLPGAGGPTSGGPAVPPAFPPPGSPPSSAATTSPAADLPVEVTLVVPRTARAGDLFDVRVEWTDPDLPPDRRVAHRIDIDEPTSGSDYTSDVVVEGACTGGSGASGVIQEPVQFASSGTRMVEVTLHTCSGPPEVVSAEVVVTAPTFHEGQDDQRPGRAIMAGLPAAPKGPTGWVFDPDQGDPIPIGPAAADTTHPVLLEQGDDQVAGVGTVLIVPAGTSGTLRYSNGATTYVGAVSSEPSGVSTLVPMQLIG